ncbi:response regulator [Desulfobacterales bacterium HSG16]|nr:response regulator [Desulfobacterales bacterium HSG16]
MKTMEKTILIVDDEEDIRDVLEILFVDMGYKVFTAEGGEEALGIFEKDKPYIVLSDIKMPGIDGIELLQKIKEQDPDTEVIMITGHGDMDLAIKSLKYDATDFVTKPINDDILEIALKRAHERISMRRKIREYTLNLEQLVEEKSRKLIEAEKLAAVGQTIAGLSHAIKNIAGGLKGGTFILEQGIEQDDKTCLDQGWKMVKGNVDKIKNLSIDLLNYGKSAESSFRLCDPGKPVIEVVNLMRPRAEQSEINLTMKLFHQDFSTDRNLIHFDPEGLHICLLNLVTNAIDAFNDDFIKDNEKDIVVATRSDEQWGFEYRVKDNGCGMDEETRKNLFKPFFTTKGSEGTGIGLMMTKKIIHQHKGTIYVKSDPGEGTEFIIRIPAKH